MSSHDCSLPFGIGSHVYIGPALARFEGPLMLGAREPRRLLAEA